MDRKLKILVVEDSPSMREMIARELTADGHSVVSEEDGSAAWNYLDEVNPAHVDLIISDWNMPVMTGFDLLKKVRTDSRFKELPFIILTTIDEWKNVLGAVEHGASQFLLKPFNLEALKKKIGPLFGANA